MHELHSKECNSENKIVSRGKEDCYVIRMNSDLEWAS